MITVILENQFGAEEQRIAQEGNESYLCQEDARFPLLSEVERYSYSVFAHTRMPNLMEELTRLAETLSKPHEVSHVRDILAMAKRCEQESGSVLAFTPFK